MSKIDLKPLSLAELKALKGRVETAIARHDKQRKSKALAAIKAKAKELGFKLSDLAGGVTEKAEPKKAKTKKAPAKPKYRDPKDKSNTWAGRGARPAWLKDALEKGAKLEDFKI